MKAMEAAARNRRFAWSSGWKALAFASVIVLFSAGCEVFRGPDRTGEFQLSSQLFGSDSYYLFGYKYEDSDFYRYPFRSEPVPDIINEAFRVIQGVEVGLLPGFNTPSQVNGFALLGEFSSLEEADEFYRTYLTVQDDLQYETVSDTVELYQVWIQKTAENNYVKMLIRDIATMTGETGAMYNEVTIEYTYQPDGSRTFSD